MKIKPVSVIIVSIAIIVICVMGYFLWWQRQQIVALNSTLANENNNISQANFDINNVKGAIPELQDAVINAQGNAMSQDETISANTNVLNSMLDKVSQDLVSTDTESNSTQN